MHAAKRRVVARHFTPTGLARLEPAARQIAKELVDDVAERGTCDFVTDLAEPLPARVTCRLLGLPEERFAEFSGFAQALLDASDERDESDTPGPVEARGRELSAREQLRAGDRRQRPFDAQAGRAKARPAAADRHPDPELRADEGL